MLKKAFLGLCILYTLFLITVSFINVYNIPELGTNNDDKIYHIITYGILGILWVYYFKKNQAKTHTFIWLLIALILFGIMVEFLQHQVNPKRQFEWLDMLANILGVIFGSIFVYGLSIFKLK